LRLNHVLHITLLCLLAVGILPACQPAPGAHGTLAGAVVVGPLVPVERPGEPTPSPVAEVFTSRGLLIFSLPNDRLAAELRFRADGSYRVELPAGDYRVELAPTGIDRAEGLPAEVHIRSGQVTYLDVSIDTGIR